MKSISTRLNTGMAISLVVVFIILGMTTSLSLRFLIESYVDSRAEHDAEGLLTALDTGRRMDAPALRPGRINPVYQRIYSGHYYHIRIGDRVLRSRSLWDYPLSIPSPDPGKATSDRVEGPEGQLLWLRTATYRKHDQIVTIAVAENLTPIQADVRRLQAIFILMSIAALLVLLFVQWRVLRVGLAPLRASSVQLEQVTRGEREALDTSVPAEILPLVQGFNRLLSVMRQRLLRSRHALGNLAHALKTPLTLIAQAAARPEMARCADIQNELKRQVDSLKRLMDRELRRAQLAGSGGVSGRIDVVAEFRSLVEVLERMFAGKSLRFEVAAPERLSFAADREDMLELFGNLLDNACKWARGRIRVTISDAQGLRVRIEDDGPGVPVEDRQKLTERGTRIDESTAGHGLGLAIVRDIIEQYGGELTLSTSATLGGLAVVVHLPAAG